MKKRKPLAHGRSAASGMLLLLILAAIFLVLGWGPETGAAAPAREVETSPEAPAGSNTAYIPFLANQFYAPTVFGVEMGNIEIGTNLTFVQNAETYWVRKNGLKWSDIQPTQGGPYLWSNAASLEWELEDARAANLQVILVVRGTPSWAQQKAGFECGPIKSQHLADFGKFVAEAVKRFSAPPYNVRYYELWNEPDVDPDIVGSATAPFGCWGDDSDPYYGGRYFGDMLKVVYPMVKNANPGAQIISGGLLMDCDPRIDPVQCLPSKFFEGVLVSGAKNSFDIAAFHGYDHYNHVIDTFGNPGWASGKYNGEPNGVLRPVFINKMGYLRQLLVAHGVPNKPIINTEGALICGGALDPPGGPGCEALDTSPYEIMKTAYLAQSYAAALGEGLIGNIWFYVKGWRNSGLMYPNSTPRPAFFAFKFSRQMLWQAGPFRTVTEFSDVTGYEFTRSANTNLWVIWATDGNTQNVTLPFTPTAIWDVLGNPVAVTGNSVNLTIAPYYIEAP